MTHKRIPCPACEAKGYHKTPTGIELCLKCHGCGRYRVKSETDPEPYEYHSGSIVSLRLLNRGNPG